MTENHKINQDILSFIERYCNKKCVVNLRTIRSQLSEWYTIDNVYRCLWDLHYDNNIELKRVGELDYEICIAA